MKRLQILMPMGGLGSRFADAGYTTPKPLIPVDGVAMFQKAISSLDSLKIPKDYYFVIRQEHVENQQLDTLIKQVLPEANVIVIPSLTRGAAETALAAENALNPNDGLIIMDCDLWFKSDGYEKMVHQSLEGLSDITGGLLTFTADNPRYSYAEINNDGYVMRTAEKQVISQYAITGAYFFSNAQAFIDVAHKLLRTPISQTMPEYYISNLYNILIANGKKVKAATIDQFASFGTPEELTLYKQAKNNHGS